MRHGPAVQQQRQHARKRLLTVPWFRKRLCGWEWKRCDRGAVVGKQRKRYLLRESKEMSVGDVLLREMLMNGEKCLLQIILREEGMRVDENDIRMRGIGGENGIDQFFLRCKVAWRIDDSVDYRNETAKRCAADSRWNDGRIERKHVDVVLFHVVQRFLNVLVGMESHRDELGMMEVRKNNNAIGGRERRQVMSNGRTLTIVNGNALNLAGQNSRNTVQTAYVPMGKTLERSKHRC